MILGAEYIGLCQHRAERDGLLHVSGQAGAISPTQLTTARNSCFWQRTLLTHRFYSRSLTLLHRGYMKQKLLIALCAFVPSLVSANTAPVGYNLSNDTLYYNDGGSNVVIPLSGSTPPPATGGFCVNFADFSPEADGVNDDTPEFNQFLDAVKAHPSRTGCINAATYRIASQPNMIDEQVHLVGSGMIDTVLLRDYNATVGNGLLSFTAGSNGSRVSALSILAASGTTGGSAISVRSTPTYPISFIAFEDLYLSTFGNNTWDSTFFIDGTQKTTAPAGVRDVAFRNVHIFGASNFSLNIRAVNGFSYHGGGVYAAGGTSASSGGIAIGGTASNQSNYINISLPVCGGLNLTNSNYGFIDCASIGTVSGFSINNDSSASFYRTRGALSGSLVNNWRFSRHD